MPQYANNRQHLLVLFIGFSLAMFVYMYFSRKGDWSFLFIHINQQALAKLLAIVSFGLYTRWCYEPDVPPNEQAIELFLGNQTGEVFKESNIVFVAKPFYSIWKRVSIQHFSFTVAAQNRTKEGHSMIVFATGKAVPVNVQLLAKMSQEHLQEQVVGLAMLAIGTYINEHERATLLYYPVWDISGRVGEFFSKHDLYGLELKVFTTKVVEENQATKALFDARARQTDMEHLLVSIRRSLPGISDVELFAAYASIAGVTPAVMSHVIHGNSGSHLILGNDGN